MPNYEDLAQMEPSPAKHVKSMYDQQYEGRSPLGDGRVCTCIMAGREPHMEINIWDLPNYVCMGCGASEQEVNATRQAVTKNWQEGGSFPTPPQELGLYLPQSAWDSRGWRPGRRTGPPAPARPYKIGGQ